MAEYQDRSAGLFVRAGLRQTASARFFPRIDEDDRSPAARLRDIFQQLGGLYAALGRFLLWRADLLDAQSLAEFRKLKADPPPLPIERVKKIARDELGSRADELIRELEPQPVWSTLSRTAWRSKYQCVPVVVQIARDAPTDSEWAAFEKNVILIDHPELIRVTRPAILAQFREWMDQGLSLAQEGRYLRVLSAYREDSLCAYPIPIEEISTDALLVWPWIDGRPVMSNGGGSCETVTQLATAVLEQFCGLSMVDGDFDPDAMGISAENRLIIRRLNRAVAVPPSLVNVGMKYIASVLASEDTLVIQNLAMLAGGSLTAQRERDLTNALSGIAPELKIRLWYPPTAGAFESNWRALAQLQPARPMFLDLLHRNLIAVGYWNGEAVAGLPKESPAKREDAIQKAQGPVVSSLLRGQMTRFLDPKLLAEWSVGAGLLMFGAMKETMRLAEEARDHNVTIGVDTPLPGNGAEPDSDGNKRRGGLTYCVVLALLLAVMLAAMRYGSHAAGTTSGILRAVALSAAGGLFWVASKI